jgi:hypothetical protein
MISPNYSYFVANNIDISASAGYFKLNLEENYNDNTIRKNRQHGFNAQISARKYFLFENKIGIRTGPYAYYNNSTNKYDNSGNSTSKYTNSDYGGGILLDFVYYPSKKLD